MKKQMRWEENSALEPALFRIDFQLLVFRTFFRVKKKYFIGDPDCGSDEK